MLDTDNTIQFYADQNGNPLQGGKVYFGVAGQNPVTSPLTVYWDAAGTQPADQPIAVKNGLTTRNGNAARVYIPSDYSKLVQDTLGRQVSFDASLFAPLRAAIAAARGAALSGFLQGGVGAVSETVETFLRRNPVKAASFMSDAEKADALLAVPLLDHSASVTKALQFAADNNRAIQFDDGLTFVLSNVRFPNRTTCWHIIGFGAKVLNPATGVSATPSLYFTALAGSGGNARVFAYSSGVRFYGLHFVGTNGNGVGYKHAVAGGIHVEFCTFENLGTSVKCLGVAGARFAHNNFISATDYHLHFAALASDTFTVNYVAEGTGWNDGIVITGNTMNGCRKLIYHEGSTSEGVIQVLGNILTAATEALVEMIAPLQNVLIEGNWTEFVNNAGADMIRLLKKPVSNFENSGRAVIRGNHFFNGDAMRYVVFSEWRNLDFDGNVIQIATSTYTGVVWANSGATRKWTAAKTLTPAATVNFNTLGEISFNVSDLADIGGNQSMYYMTDGTKNYLLTFIATFGGGTGAVYGLHRYTKVYPRQFPTFGANWLNTAEVSLRSAAIGVSVDLDNKTTGDTFVGPTVTVDAAVNGGIDTGSLTLMRNNTFMNVPADKWYQQREFGKVRMDNNSYFGGT